jgi:chlorite dismutase
MPDTRLAPLTLDGWYVLHQGFRISWPRLKDLPDDYRREAARELAEVVSGWEEPEKGGWSGAYRMVGGGLDLMLVHFRPTLDDLGEAERALKRTDLSDLLYLEMDYVSVVELGLYRLTAEKVGELRDAGIDPRSEEGREALRAAAEEHADMGYVQDRLHPRQPEEMPYLCFYPMDKRREPGQNWYTLTLDERNELMVEHGGIGRQYAGRVSQVISGSVGFDDWEWGVTLWTGEPLDFKELVTEMRYDEVSAVYAEFGPFFVGRRLSPDELLGDLT